MSARNSSARALGFVGLALLVVSTSASSGCDKQAGATAAPSDELARERGPGSDVSDPLAELDQLEGRMTALGLPTRAKARANRESEDGEKAGGASDGEAADLDLEAGPEAAAEEAPAPEPAPTLAGGSESQRDEQPDSCTDLCGLSESICALEVQICELSESHADDPIYIDACERAREDCEVTDQACDGCGSGR